MAILNWSETDILLHTHSVSARETQLAVTLSSTQIQELGGELEAMVDPQGESPHSFSRRELRLVLPQNWLLFWKLDATDVRFLVAHPDRDSWVGTIALSGDGAKRLIAGLKSLGPGEKFLGSQLGSVNPVSNLSWVIQSV
jgi:hypothetical protein